MRLPISDLYIKIGRFVRLTGSVSECRTAGMPIVSHCQPYADHAALRPYTAVFDRRHCTRRRLGRARPHARIFTQMCKMSRRTGRGRLQRAAYRAMSYSLSTLREKGEEEEGRGGRKREGYMAMCAALMNSSKYLCLAGCGHSFFDIRKLKLRKHT